MENGTEKKLLPIGTIVLLKNANTELMITGYNMAPLKSTYREGEEPENIEDSVYDYGGCRYPEGIIYSNTMTVFDHNQIEKVIHMGLETTESDEYLSEMQKTMDEIFKVARIKSNLNDSSNNNSSNA